MQRLEHSARSVLNSHPYISGNLHLLLFFICASSSFFIMCVCFYYEPYLLMPEQTWFPRNHMWPLSCHATVCKYVCLLCRSKLNGRIYFAWRFFRVFDRGQNICFFGSAVKNTNMPLNKFLQHRLILTGTIRKCHDLTWLDLTWSNFLIHFLFASHFIWKLIEVWNNLKFIVYYFSISY